MQVLKLGGGGHVFGMDEGLWSGSRGGEGRGGGGGGEGRRGREEGRNGRGRSEPVFTIRPLCTERCTALRCGCMCACIPPTWLMAAISCTIAPSSCCLLSTSEAKVVSKPSRNSAGQQGDRHITSSTHNGPPPLPYHPPSLPSITLQA